MNLVSYARTDRSWVVAPAPIGERIVPPFGPLEGLRVIDSGRFVAGPWGGTYLGEFGAEVIHVEGPPFGPPYADPTRLLSPVVPTGAIPPLGVSESWVQYARNKLSLGLDLRRPEGREVFLDLVRRSEERRVGKECCLVCRSRWSP